MAKKSPTKKKAAKKTAAKRTMGATPMGANLQTLTQAGVVPAGYSKFSPADHAAMEMLSVDEVAAVISAQAKIGKKPLMKLAAHGHFY